MSIWNIGSLTTFVYGIVENIPAGISGNNLNEIAYQQVLFAEQYTGDTIGSLAIAEKYQPALIDLTASEVINLMNLTGIDVSSISLGPLSVNKGASSSTDTTSKRLKENGVEKLRILGKNVKFYKAFG